MSLVTEYKKRIERLKNSAIAAEKKKQDAYRQIEGAEAEISKKKLEIKSIESEKTALAQELNEFSQQKDTVLREAIDELEQSLGTDDSSLQIEKMTGLYLKEPHAELIAEKKKTLIIKSKLFTSHIGEEIYLCSDSLVYGIIKLLKPTEISQEDFGRLKDRHLISDEEAKDWGFKAKDKLYAYEFEIIKIFDKAKDFILEQGVQNWIKDVIFKEENIPDDELFEVIYASEELEKIQNIVEYDASKIDDAALKDDARIVAAWFSTADDPSKKIKFTKEQIVELAAKIYKEIAKRKKEKDFKYKVSPDKMSEGARKLWELVKEKLGNEEVELLLAEQDSKKYIVICGNCKQEINYLNEPEKGMGYIECPKCKASIDQEGNFTKKPEEIEYPAIVVEELKSASDDEVLTQHRKAHEMFLLYEEDKFKDIELLVNNHILIVEEMRRRGLEHKAEDGLDEKSKELRRFYDLSEKDLLFEHEKAHASFDMFDSENFAEFRFIQEKHDAIVKAFEEKKIQHHSKEDFLDDYAEFMKKQDLAEVHPSGEHNKHREKITLDEILPFFKSFRARSPFVYLTGGLCNNEKTTNDIDILFNCTKEELKMPLMQMIVWRLMRSLPRRYWNKLQFLPNSWSGPITNNIPLFELSCLRTNLKNEVFQMAYDEDEDFLKALIRTKNPKSERQARKAKKEDKVTLGEYFLPLKPVRGAFPYQRMTVDSFIALFKDEDFPVFNSSKRDGFNSILIKDGKEVTIFSEDGELVTHRFPNLVEDIKKLNADQIVLLAEIEMWINKIHQPREAVAGYAHQKGEPDDSNIVANVYDCIFFNKDIHNLGFEMRKQYLDKLNFKQSVNGVPDVKIKLNKIPHVLCKNKEELRKTTEKLREIYSSEGVVAKMARATYNLAGKRSGQIKFHNNAAINVIVLDRQETRVKNVWNYVYGIDIGKEKIFESRIREIDGKKYLLLGKTFSTAADLKTGDKFILEFETLNVEYHEKEDAYKLTCWVPRFIKETKEAIDDIKSTIAKAKKENHVLQEKDVLETGEIIYKSVEFEKQDPYAVIPEEDKAPYKYTVQRHFRGQGSHLDLRIESKDKEYLIGWTIMDLLAGKIKEPVTSLEEANKVNKQDYFKIEWDKTPAKMKMRRTAAGNIVPTELRAAEKAAEPKIWLDVEGIMPKGEVGATKEFPGVFTIIDKGTLSYGSTKPYFKEYFFGNQGKLQGRWLMRQIAEWRREEKSKTILPTSVPPERPETKGFFWVLIQAIDQTPYVLSDRAIEKSWVPPQNYSALPPELKKKVPSEFQYWKAKDEAKRVRLRDDYVKFLKSEKKYEELKKSCGPDLSEYQRPRIDEVLILANYLNADIKDIYPNTLMIPTVRAGNFFNAFSELTKDLTFIETRNFSSSEIPPVYKEIKLKKNLSQIFLVEGFHFFYDEEKKIPIITQVSPIWGGFILKLITHAKYKDQNIELMKLINQFSTEHNLLKGEKFSVSGEFIDAYDLSLEDLKLTKSLQDRIEKLISLIKNFDPELSSRGLLFLGPPGCGKTLTGKVLSNLSPTFIWVTTKDFYEMYPKTMIVEAFSLARELSPSILFFEDIDSYLEGEIIDLFKTELDGLRKNTGVFTILTSNFPERLPEAIIDRPGRFHDVLHFTLPNNETRREMFLHFLKDEEFDLEIVEMLIQKTEGYSGAHIKEICTFAKIISKEDGTSLTSALVESLNRLIEQRKLIADLKNKKPVFDDLLPVKKSLSEKYCLTEEEIATINSGEDIGKAIGSFDFVLQHHWFKRWNWKEDKPVIVVRAGPSEEHFDLRIDTGELPIWHWVLAYDPRTTIKTTALYKPCKDRDSMDKGKPGENKDYLKPGTSDWNPTKDTRAWVEMQDSGKALVLIDKPTFKRIQFKGKTLKGVYTLEREDPKSDFWVLEKSKLPVTKK